MKRFCLSLLGTSLGACAPLEQAPLVYASTEQVGVSVASGVPESPGLKLDIGVKLLDAAYVPVAFSKPCPTGTRKCDFILSTVLGESENSTESLRNDTALNDNRRQISDNDEKIKTKQDEANALSKTLAQMDERDAKQKALDDLKATGNAPPSEVEALQTQVSALPDSAQKGVSIAKRTSVQAEIDSLVKQNQDLIQTNRQIEAAAAARRGDNRRDSLSVYGTFNGNTAAEQQKASLVYGKVFSTGVAAQNLTRGIESGVRASERTRCAIGMSETAATLSKEGKDAAAKDILAAIPGACGQVSAQ